MSEAIQEIIVTAADLENPQHQHAILMLLNAYARDPMGSGHDLPAEVQARLIPALRQHPTTQIWLAWRGNDAVGIAVCFLGFSTFAARPLLNIHDIAVLPECRGQGVGQRLLEEVEQKGRALGCCKLTLEVREDNQRAQRLYDYMGFHDIGSHGDTIRHWFLEKRL